MQNSMSGAKGGGSSFTQKPDTLRSNDTFEGLLGLCAGPIKGPVRGLKSIRVNGTPIEGEDDTLNFPAFTALFADGDPLKFPQVAELKLGAGGSPDTVGANIRNAASAGGNPWVTHTLGNTGANAIDLRFVVQNLYHQTYKGIYEGTLRLEIQMKPVGTTTWINPFAANGDTTPAYSETGFNTSDGLLRALISRSAYDSNVARTSGTAGDGYYLVITGKTTSPYIHELRVQVPNTGAYADKAWDIRVRLLDTESYDSPEGTAEKAKISDRRLVQWESVTAVYSGNLGNHEDWRGLAWLQIYGKASDNFTGLPEIDGIYDTKIVSVPPSTVYDPLTRLYTGTIWDGSWAKAFSRDPAWVINDAISDSISGIAAFVPGASLNKWDALELSKWASELVPDGAGGTHPRYSMDLYVDQPQKADEFIRYLAGAVGAAAWDNGDGEWRLKVDKPETPSNIFTHENIEGEFLYSHTDVDTRFNDVTVVFLNEEFDYKEDRVRARDFDDIEANGRKPTQVVAIGCTNRQQALRLAVLRLRTNLNEKRMVTFQTNRQGKYLERFDHILIADGSLGQQNSTGRVILKASDGLAVTVRDPVRLEVGAAYQLHFTIPNPAYDPEPASAPTDPTWDQPSITLTRNITNTAGQRGDVTVLYLDGSVPADMPENAVVALSAVGLPTLPKVYRVVDVGYDDDGERVSVNAMEVDTGKWDAADNATETLLEIETPTYNIPMPQAPSDGDMFHLDTYRMDTGTRPVLTVRWERPVGRYTTTYNVRYRVNEGPWRLLEETGDTTVEIHDPDVGVYNFEITANDRRGRISQPLTGTFEVEEILSNISLVGYLTNESHTVPADSAGNVTSYAGASGLFVVMIGATDVTADCTFEPIVNAQNLAGSKSAAAPYYTLIDATGAYDVTSGFDAGEAAASVTYRATHTPSGATIDKVFSLSKSIAGTDGTDGVSPPLVSLTASARVFQYDKNGDLVAQTINFNATRQNGSMGAISWNVYDGAGTLVVSGNSAALAATGYFTNLGHDFVSMSQAQFATFTNYGAITARDSFTVEAVYDGITDRVSINTLRDGTVTELVDNMNYGSVEAFKRRWNTYGNGNGSISVVPSDNRGGYSIKVGDNAGDDFVGSSFDTWMDYSPEDLYEVWFDVEIGASDMAALMYLGVQMVDRAGNSLAGNGSYAYVAAGALGQGGNLGRRTYRGYMRGTGPNTVITVANDPANPSPLSDGSYDGFGQGGTVRIRPIFLVNYNLYPGQVTFHGVGIRKVDDATVNPRGEWNKTTVYYRNDSVTWNGRTFGAKSKHSGQVPPATATSNTYWYLIADKGASTFTLTLSDPASMKFNGNDFDSFDYVSTGGGGWGSRGAYSPQMFGPGCTLTYKAPAVYGANEYFMVGLNSDPAADNSYPSIDFCNFHYYDGSTFRHDIYESGSGYGVGVWSGPDIYKITYTGEDIVYSRINTGGVEIEQRRVWAGPNRQFALDIAVGDKCSLRDLTFTPGSAQGTYGTTFTPVLSAGMARKGSGFINLTTPADWGYRAVYSKEKIANARVSFRPGGANAGTAYFHGMMGLNSDPTTNDSYNSIDEAMHPIGDGSTIGIYQNAANPANPTPGYTTTDILSVEQREDVVFYCKNGTPFYVSTISRPDPMHFDSAFIYAGAEVQDVVFGPAPALPDFFEPGMQKMTRSGSTWAKGALTDGWDDAGFISRDGFVGAQLDFTVSQTDKHLTIGLMTSRSLAKNLASMPYAIYLTNVATVQRMEAGSNTSLGFAYAAGDKFTLKHSGTTIEILKNGVQLHQWTGINPSQKFWACGVFYSSGGQISNLTFVGAGQHGTRRDVKYLISATQPATPTGDSPAGWSDTIPSGSGRKWMTIGTKNYANKLIGVWSTPTSTTDLVPRGAWSSTASYVIGDLVTYNGGTYVCVANHSNQAPSGTDQGTAYWDVYAAPGEDGSSTPPSGWTPSAINLTSSTGTVNLRSIADANGYPGGDATVTFNVPNGVTIRGLAGAAGIDSGSWPAGHTINITLVVQSGGIVDGGGGDGGQGNSYSFDGYYGNSTDGTVGNPGGDAIYCRRAMTVTINAGGTVRGGGGGGGGGVRAPSGGSMEIGWGSAGGGGAPNGTPGGSTSGGGSAPGGTGDGYDSTMGGAGGTFATAGGAGAYGGGAAGYAVRKNGNTVSVSNSGTMTGTAA